MEFNLFLIFPNGEYKDSHHVTLSTTPWLPLPPSPPTETFAPILHWSRCRARPCHFFGNMVNTPFVRVTFWPFRERLMLQCSSSLQQDYNQQFCVPPTNLWWWCHSHTTGSWSSAWFHSLKRCMVLERLILCTESLSSSAQTATAQSVQMY